MKDNVVLSLRFSRGSGSHQEAHIIYTFARTNGKHVVGLYSLLLVDSNTF
ncbi:hypothetical protein LSO9J_20095 [Candidatus Liberibacter solanacearum]